MPDFFLTTADKHILKLICRDAQPNGWTAVSSVVMPAVKSLPNELIEILEDDRGGFVRLTEEGNLIVGEMARLSM